MYTSMKVTKQRTWYNTYETQCRKWVFIQCQVQLR